MSHLPVTCFRKMTSTFVSTLPAVVVLLQSRRALRGPTASAGDSAPPAAIAACESASAAAAPAAGAPAATA